MIATSNYVHNIWFSSSFPSPLWSCSILHANKPIVHYWCATTYHGNKVSTLSSWAPCTGLHIIPRLCSCTRREAAIFFSHLSLLVFRFWVFCCLVELIGVELQQQQQQRAGHRLLLLSTPFLVFGARRGDKKDGRYICIYSGVTVVRVRWSCTRYSLEPRRDDVSWCVCIRIERVDRTAEWVSVAERSSRAGYNNPRRSDLRTFQSKPKSRTVFMYSTRSIGEFRSRWRIPRITFSGASHHQSVP